MTPEERAKEIMVRNGLESKKTTAPHAMALLEAEIEAAIREAVDAERRACAEVIRGMIRDDATGNEEVGYMQGLEDAATAIEARSNAEEMG